MGVDINQYRAAIGTYVRNGPFKIRRKYANSCNEKMLFSFKMIKFLLLICLGFTLVLAEPNNTEKREDKHLTCIAGKHKLLSAI